MAAICSPSNENGSKEVPVGPNIVRRRRRISRAKIYNLGFSLRRTKVDGSSKSKSAIGNG